MPAANSVKRRVQEKHRLKRLKLKAKKRGIDTSNPFWRLLLSRETTTRPTPATRPSRQATR